ncbi:hypothetical protein NtRootA9_28990 [Arthrobacter sp. NtRootA9]|nr:hypothetical protein NtRootA9_28990 [Arthrobacter sp. NtRootA9]
MNSETRLQAALFGERNGVGWVSSDVFVTRKAEVLLVEGWIGPRLVSVRLSGDFRVLMPNVWLKLSEIAVVEG